MLFYVGEKPVKRVTKVDLDNVSFVVQHGEPCRKIVMDNERRSRRHAHTFTSLLAPIAPMLGHTRLLVDAGDVAR